MAKKNKKQVQVKVARSNFWESATLISVAKHRNDGALIFGETKILKKNVQKNYERIWRKVEVKEDYQQRINELLDLGEVVLTVTG